MMLLPENMQIYANCYNILKLIMNIQLSKGFFSLCKNISNPVVNAVQTEIRGTIVSLCSFVSIDGVEMCHRISGN